MSYFPVHWDHTAYTWPTISVRETWSKGWSLAFSGRGLQKIDSIASLMFDTDTNVTLAHVYHVLHLVHKCLL
jgi:hypothetical protein